MIKNVVGGLGIFLLGMKMMSEGMQALAGSRLNRWIATVTDNRLMAVVAGTGVTCIIQSSSATTVMVVGFVNSGLMTLMQAIGVIFGANVGTTVSVWIMTLDVSQFGSLLLGASALVYLFAVRERVRHISMALLGVGMLLFGLELMSRGFVPLRESQVIEAWFRSFQADTYLSVMKCALVGCVVTMVVQSSHATVALTIGLAQAGLVSFDSAVALVLGENLGTTITAIIASAGTSRNARRAALAHVVFNLCGVLWITAAFHIFFIHLVRGSATGLAAMLKLKPLVSNGAQIYDFAYPRLGIAMAHTLFNVVNTLMFIPFMGSLAKAVTWMIPLHPSETEDISEHYRPIYIDRLMLETPSLAIEQTHKEILAMGDANMRMLADLLPVMTTNERHPEAEERIKMEEARLDEAQHFIINFLSRLISYNISPAFATEARRQLRRADEYESVSDYIRHAAKIRNRLRKEEGSFSDCAIEELKQLHERTTAFAAKVNDIVRERDVSQVPAARKMNAELVRQIKDIRDHHLARIVTDEISSKHSVFFSDVLVAYRRMKDHLLNIIDTLTE